MTQAPSQQIALVTGATRGIGAAIAQALAASGMTVIGTATSAAGAEKISAALAAQFGTRANGAKQRTGRNRPHPPRSVLVIHRFFLN